MNNELIVIWVNDKSLLVKVNDQVNNQLNTDLVHDCKMNKLNYSVWTGNFNSTAC